MSAPAKKSFRFARVSKDILGALYGRSDLTAIQMRLIHYVIDKTYGERDSEASDSKKMAPFTGQEIAERLGIDARNARRHLLALVSRGILICYEEQSGKRPGIYGVQKRVEKWMSPEAARRVVSNPPKPAWAGHQQPAQDTLGGLSTTRLEGQTENLGGLPATPWAGHQQPATRVASNPPSHEETVTVSGIPAAVDKVYVDNKISSSSSYLDPNSTVSEEEKTSKDFLTPEHRTKLQAKAHQVLLETSPGGLTSETHRRLNAYLAIRPPTEFTGDNWGRKLIRLLLQAIEEATAQKLAGEEIRSLPLVALSKASQNAGLESKKKPKTDINKGVKFIR